MNYRLQPSCCASAGNPWTPNGPTRRGDLGRRRDRWRAFLRALAAPAVRLHRYRNLRGLMFDEPCRRADRTDRP